MVRIRLITKDPRNCPDCCKPSLRLTHYQLLESGEKGSPCLKAWYISQSINYTDCQSSENTQSLFSNLCTNFRFSPSQQENKVHKRSKESYQFWDSHPRAKTSSHYQDSLTTKKRLKHGAPPSRVGTSPSHPSVLQAARHTLTYDSSGSDTLHFVSTN